MPCPCVVAALLSVCSARFEDHADTTRWGHLMIRFDAVTKQFPDGTIAVDDLTLTAPTGKITVLVGPSGCGKTTSLRMVNRMIEPTSGTISLDGQDTGRMNAAELRRGIGYVIQHAGLFPHRTVLDNIGTVPRLLGWDKKRIRDVSAELLERVGLAPELGARYPAQLSGGQQQRVGVARALAADPPVMLMDEPFSAVDPVVRDQLQDEFLRLQSELGKTILFVTHDIDEAIKLGDQVAVLRVGGGSRRSPSPRTCSPTRPTTSSPTSWGATAGTAPCSSSRCRDCRCAPSRPCSSAKCRPSDAAWLLVVDGSRRPVGWVEPGRVGQRAVTEADLHRGGTVARAEGSLRGALDAALSSPSRRGVIVDDAVSSAGTVLAHEVLTAIEETDRPDRDEGPP
jgi:osmoprotectant transport system ATP-binding protein